MYRANLITGYQKDVGDHWVIYPQMGVMGQQKLNSGKILINWMHLTTHLMHPN